MSKLLAERYVMRLSYIGQAHPATRAHYRRCYLMYGKVFDAFTKS